MNMVPENAHELIAIALGESDGDVIVEKEGFSDAQSRSKGE